jgi:hypothetical protein
MFTVFFAFFLVLIPTKVPPINVRGISSVGRLVSLSKYLHIINAINVNEADAKIGLIVLYLL